MWLIFKKCKVQKQKQNKFIRYRIFKESPTHICSRAAEILYVAEM